jgi:hypothetical protein
MLDSALLRLSLHLVHMRFPTLQLRPAEWLLLL